MNWKEHIVQTPDTCFGRPRIRGTRISVDFILRRLSHGATPEQIVSEYPHLTVEGVQASLAYAADWLEMEDTIFAPQAGTREAAS